MTKKIGILGGTFDPPHLAHLVIAQEAKEACQLDEVWFIPVYQPPHKEREGTASSSHRLKMTEYAISNNEHFQLSTVEIERQGPSYTVDTLEQFKQRYPGKEFYFIIGGDMAEQLDEWKGIERLRELVTFIAIERPSYHSTPPFKEGVISVEAPSLDIASSMIRERVKNKQSIRYLVPEIVRNYIEEQCLYE